MENKKDIGYEKVKLVSSYLDLISMSWKYPRFPVEKVFLKNFIGYLIDIGELVPSPEWPTPEDFIEHLIEENTSLVFLAYMLCYNMISMETFKSIVGGHKFETNCLNADEICSNLVKLGVTINERFNENGK